MINLNKKILEITFAENIDEKKQYNQMKKAIKKFKKEHEFESDSKLVMRFMNKNLLPYPSTCFLIAREFYYQKITIINDKGVKIIV